MESLKFRVACKASQDADPKEIGTFEFNFAPQVGHLLVLPETEFRVLEVFHSLKPSSNPPNGEIGHASEQWLLVAPAISHSEKGRELLPPWFR